MNQTFVCTRIGLLLLLMVALGPAQGHAQAPPEDGARAFDFEFGEWKAHVSRRVDPLTGSDTWVEFEGTSIIHEIWDGRANLGELEVEGPTGRIEGLSMRLYNPGTRLWSIRWANSRDGELGEPMIGRFHDGIGEFYNQEMFNGQAVFVRFIFSDITENSFRLEQAFSADGGNTWEANWIARFERRLSARPGA